MALQWPVPRLGVLAEGGERIVNQLKAALSELSPPGEVLVPGELRRISPTDSIDYPTIRMPYGLEVPLVHTSAAIRRIVALSYLLIWAWQEHRQAAAQRREPPANRIVFLVDEIEAHLHPRWQRRVLPSLLRAVEALTVTGAKPLVQLFATTHSPLICVSLEPVFDEDQDRIFTLDLDSEGKVSLENPAFVKRGTSQNWLDSDTWAVSLDAPSRRRPPSKQRRTWPVGNCGNPGR